MDRHTLHAAAYLLTPEEQKMLLHRGDAADEEGPVMEMHIRSGMCDALSGMERTVSDLLTLLEHSSFSQSLSCAQQTAYNNMVIDLKGATKTASIMVNRSRSFDEDAYLTLAPEAAYTRQ